MKAVKFFNNKPVRVYTLNNGYWYAIKDLCDAINFPEEGLTYRLDSNELDCYVKPLEFGPLSVRCISHEGLETCCYRNDIDECYQVQDWIKDLYIYSGDDKMLPTLNTVRCLNDHVTFIKDYDNVWVFVTDICRILNYSDKYELTKHLDGFDCFKVFQISGDRNAGRWTECIELEGIKRVCQSMNNEVGRLLLDWVNNFEKDSGIVEKINTLMRLEKVKDLCEYFDIDPKDERICSLVNCILDELE